MLQQRFRNARVIVDEQTNTSWVEVDGKLVAGKYLGTNLSLRLTSDNYVLAVYQTEMDKHNGVEPAGGAIIFYPYDVKSMS